MKNNNGSNQIINNTNNKEVALRALSLKTSLPTTEIKVGDNIVVRRWALGREELSDATVIETRTVIKYSILTGIFSRLDEQDGLNLTNGINDVFVEEHIEPNHKRFRADNEEQGFFFYFVNVKYRFRR